MNNVSEQEQIQVIKDWWRENGKFTVIMIIAALVLSFGWRYWGDAKTKKAEAASLIYEQMKVSADKNASSIFERQATELMSKYRSTPYASLAALTWSKLAIEAGMLDLGLEKLKWVMEKGSNSDFRQLAAIRIARILLAKHQPQEALNTLASVENVAYLPFINELRGDSWFMLGNHIKAKEAYQQALNALPVAEKHRAIIKMKREQL